ncbi:uncharacterized protein LOC143182348 [Calliopsis andreniformis]|uniref:uncharacterized protein LOC143182347 n=1 Tax=Calliopsis andreniformis TaxID=337506 RepID=UPI003FCE2A68
MFFLFFHGSNQHWMKTAHSEARDIWRRCGPPWMLNVACVRRAMSVPRSASPDPCQRLWDFAGTPSLVSVQTMRCGIRSIHRGPSTSGQLDPSTSVTTDKYCSHF